MVAGRRSDAIAASIAAVASERLLPGARLNETVVATNRPWWLTCTGALPVSRRAKAESGIMVSFALETGALEEAPPLLAAMALEAALRAESLAMAAAVVEGSVAVVSGAAAVEPVPLVLAAPFAATVPATAFVVAEPRAFPPEVET
ncbi:hypothetical protein AEGHOMDF_3541 [Methylobacterium soli]|nr:hypothetical protein AEGHOMDF_3541 [Methylobacterium soli]